MTQGQSLTAFEVSQRPFGGSSDVYMGSMHLCWVFGLLSRNHYFRFEYKVSSVDFGNRFNYLDGSSLLPSKACLSSGSNIESPSRDSVIDSS